MVKNRLAFVSPIVAFLIIAFFAGIVFCSVADTKDRFSEKNLREVRDTVLSYVSQCYSLEGEYPPDLDYLAQNYGLQFDRDKYIYHYELFASNIYPDVRVFHRAKAGDQHQK